MRSVLILALFCAFAHAIPPRGQRPNFAPPGFGAIGGGRRPNFVLSINSDEVDNEGGQPESRRDCVKSCVGPSKCPSRQEMRNETREYRKECRECVNAICGDLEPLDRRAVSKCVREAFQNCSSCPPVPIKDRERAINCTSCLMQCRKPSNTSQQRRTPTNVRPGMLQRGNGPQRRGKPARACYKVCETLKYCPNVEDMKSKMMGERQSCKDCVVDECGELKANSSSEDASCVAQARQECVDCPPVKSEEQMSRKKCFACLKSCLLRDDDDEETESNNRRPWFYGLGRLAQNRPAYGRQQPFSNMGQTSRGPLSFLNRNGPFNARNRPSPFGNTPAAGRMGYFRGGRQPSTGGYGYGPLASGGLRPFGGRRPFAGGRGPSTRRPGRKQILGALLKVITCARTEENCASCPTPKQVKHRMINATFGCRKCVRDECGDIETDNKTETAECIRQARIDCLQCPPLTEDEQMEKKKCVKCVVTCAPKGNRQGGPFRNEEGSPRLSSFGPRLGSLISQVLGFGEGSDDASEED